VKKGILKRAIIFIGIFALALGLVYLASTTSTLSRIMKTYVETELRKTLDREVAVGKISTNIVNRITLQNVAIASDRKLSEGVVLVCEKVTINYNPLLIILAKHDLGKSIVKVILKSPHLFLTGSVDKANFFLPASFQKLSILSKVPNIVIAGGTITIGDVKEKIEKFEIRNISGSLTTGERSYRLPWREKRQRVEKLSSQIYFSLSGKSNQSRNDKIKLKGTYNKETKELSLNLNIFSLDLPNYSSLFLSSPDFKVLTGEGNFSLDVKTTLNEENCSRIAEIATFMPRDRERVRDFLRILSFSGELAVARMSYRWASYTLTDIRGSIVFDNYRAGSQGIALRYRGWEFTISGGIESYLSQPALGLTVSANLELSTLSEILKTNKLNSLLPLQGSVKLSVEISESLSHPKLKGWFLSPEAEIAGRPVEGFQGQFLYQDGIVRIMDLQGKIYEGGLVLSGKIDIGQPYLDLDFAWRGIDFRNLFPPDWTDKAKGKGSISGNISGKPAEFQAEGKIDLVEVEFLRVTLGSVSGFLNYAKGKLEINANTSENNYNLSTSLLLSKEAIGISKLQITASERSRIALQGQIGLLGARKLELTVLDSYVEAGYLPWPRQRSDGPTGKVNFLGRIGGTIKSPEISGKVWSSSLQVMKERMEFNSEVYYRERVLRVNSFKLNDDYSMNLTIKFDGRIPVASGAIKTTGGDLRFISALFSGEGANSTKVGGSLKGEIDFSNLYLGDLWWENVRAKGAVSIVQATAGQFSLDEGGFGFNIDDKGLSVDKFHFSSGRGEVRGSAQMGMRRDSQNRINIDTEWRNYPLDFSSGKLVKVGVDSEGKTAASLRRARENRVTGILNFRGKLLWMKDWKIAGSFSGKDFEYNGEPLGAISANLSLNRELAHFSSFRYGSDLQGELKIELVKQKTVTGGIEVDSTKVSHFLRLMFETGREKSSLNYLNELKGNLHSKIVFSGLLENPQVNGYIDIEQGIFSTTNFIFKSTFNYDGKELNLGSAELKFAPGGTVIARGKIDFHKLEALEITAAISDMELSSVQSLFPDSKLKTFGKINGNFQLRGDFKRPGLKVALQTKGIGVNSLRADAMETEFRIEKVLEDESERVQLVFDSFSASFGQSLLRLAPESRVTFPRSKKIIDFSLVSQFRNINFARMSIFGDAELKGVANFAEDFPVLEVTLTTRDMWVNRHNFQRVMLKLSYQDRKLFFLPVAQETFQLLGEIDLLRLDNFNIRLLEFFQGKDRLVTVTGNVDLSGPIEVTVQGKEGEIAASLLGELLDLRVPIKGESGFNLKISRASIRREKGKEYDSLSVQGAINIINGSLGILLFDDFHALFSADSTAINLDELTVNKRGVFNIKSWGIIPYPKEDKDGRKIDLSLEMFDSRANVLRVLSREISDAKGEVKASLHVTGELQQPVVNGYFRIDKATLYGRQVFKRIDDLTCDILVKDSNIVINWINGKIEKGEMSFKGNVILAGWMPDKFDVVFENKGPHGIPLKIPFLKIPQSSFFGRLLSEVPCSLELKGKIHTYGTPQSYNLDGVIELENAHFTYPPRAEDTKDLNLDFLKPAVWNLEIKAGKNTWYENTFAEVQLRGQMRLDGPTKDLTVNGMLTAIKGELSYLGATFSIKEATVECINDELFLETTAECPVEDDTIILVVERGKWGKIKPKFSSRRDPEMTQEEALNKATGLDSLKFSAQEGDALLRKELLKLIDSSLASPLIRSILRSTGLVDVVKVDTALAQKTGEKLNSRQPGEGEETSSLLEGTRITLGKYLSSNLYLGYKLQFEEGFLNRLELRHEVELLYRLKRGISLKGKLGEEERYFGVERQIRF